MKVRMIGNDADSNLKPDKMILAGLGHQFNGVGIFGLCRNRIFPGWNCFQNKSLLLRIARSLSINRNGYSRV
jgi:hypothetical protein